MTLFRKIEEGEKKTELIVGSFDSVVLEKLCKYLAQINSYKIRSRAEVLFRMDWIHLRIEKNRKLF